ncbi:MAG TPA: DUF1015 domain-containing protein [Ktedonobacterales bacterium]
MDDRGRVVGATHQSTGEEERMAEVQPLPGIRYAPGEPLVELVTPPYDVISQEAQARYYERNPHNIIRLELGRDEPDDDALDNKYTRAAMLFAQWRLDGILRQDAPALYLYEQRFTVEGAPHVKTNLLARVRLEPWEARVVLPHERTLPKPKEDRLRVMRATAANLSPIMALYDDPHDELARSFVPLRRREPDVAFTDEAGEEHRVWVVPDPILAATVATFFNARPLYIADGHHRYETALAYRDEQRELRKGMPQEDAANFVLMALSSVEDRGLVVLPTHRIIRNVASEALTNLAERLGAYFTLEPLPPEDIAQWQTALANAGVAGNENAFVLVTPQGASLARLSDAGRGTMAGVRVEGEQPSEAWRTLDVAVLQELLLHRVLGIDDEAIRSGDFLTYTRDAGEAATAVRTGANGAALAALLRPTPPAAMRDVARAGDRMPQKSTYFYPKLITGLVINPLW